MFSWKNKEREILKKMSDLENALDQNTKAIHEMKVVCGEIDDDLSELSQRVSREIKEVNETSKVLTSSYLELSRQRDETVEAFRKISDKMNNLSLSNRFALPAFYKKVIYSFRDVYWSFYNFVYRHQMLVLAIVCGIVAAAGFSVLMANNTP